MVRRNYDIPYGDYKGSACISILKQKSAPFSTALGPEDTHWVHSRMKKLLRHKKDRHMECQHSVPQATLLPFSTGSTRFMSLGSLLPFPGHSFSGFQFRFPFGNLFPQPHALNLTKVLERFKVHHPYCGQIHICLVATVCFGLSCDGCQYSPFEADKPVSITKPLKCTLTPPVL
jgi:hypothetical protein